MKNGSLLLLATYLLISHASLLHSGVSTSRLSPFVVCCSARAELDQKNMLDARALGKATARKKREQEIRQQALLEHLAAQAKLHAELTPAQQKAYNQLYNQVALSRRVIRRR